MKTNGFQIVEFNCLTNTPLNPAGFFYAKPSFFLPFFGENAAHFPRITFAPSGIKKPHPKQIFLRSRQTQNCKLDLGSLLAQRQPNRAQWWKEPCHPPQQPHLTNPHQKFRFLRQTQQNLCYFVAFALCQYRQPKRKGLYPSKKRSIPFCVFLAVLDAVGNKENRQHSKQRVPREPQSAGR